MRQRDDEDDGRPPGSDDAIEPPGEREWDADDPRRKDDQFAPPTEPCECHCLHCGRTFSSEGIWFQKVINDPAGFDGFWMCPTPNCDGAGFTFDIFPTDPNHPANAGWHYCDDDEAEDGDTEWDPELDAAISAGDDEEWDPGESKYRALDEVTGAGGGGGEVSPLDDEDYEGEEWKYGLEPGERPPPGADVKAGSEEDDDESRYDRPDERPREIDWSDRTDRKPLSDPPGEDDIPF